ncbi:unnamed protein product [Rotaria magnacalcarata]|nr:unnamed protein product [Rotaria magnacalcarata]
MAWWGNIAEQTRTMVLELQRRNSILDFDEAILSNVPFRSNDKDTHSLEQNHTHFLLLDDGKYRSEHKHEEDSSSKQQSEFMKTINYPKEMQRSDFVTHACDREKCYGVTLVIEGGINTCLAILNDIQCKRPVVFVEGSGKMADVIASLMKLTAINEYTPVRKPERHEIEHNLLRFPMRARTEKEQQQQIDQIGKIMDPNNRMYLTKPKLLAKLFKQALDGDRPPFIDFFLRINYDPRRTLDFLEKEKSLANIQNYECVESTTDVHSNINIGASIQKIPISYQNQVKLNKRGVDLILRLYKDALLSNGQNLSSEYSIESAYPTSIDQLDILYSEWMGNFLPSLHSRRSSLDQIKLEIQRVLHTFRRNLCWCNTACYRQNLNTSGLDSYESTGFIVETTALFRLNQDLEAKARTIFYRITHMRESETHSWISWGLKLFFGVAPYALFYAGIFLWYGYGNVPKYFTTARIILAIDLEIWYLQSLKFISVVKILGPKLFMVKNMLRDLASFVYVAFICIAAYGVASRVMMNHVGIQFSVHSIVGNVLYTPYWFLFSDGEDEKRTLNEIIANNTNSDQIIGATATYVLLAFHLLFINILLLNLLVAVFTTTINRVENNTKYFWRYQRYIFIQKYFEKSVLAASPIILIVYVGLMLRHS